MHTVTTPARPTSYAGRIRTVLEMIKFEHSIFALPFALVPLLLLTSRVNVMESFVSARRTRIAGWAAVAVIITLNGVLLGQLAFGF